MYTPKLHKQNHLLVWEALLWITLSPNRWQSFSLRRSHTWTSSSWHKLFTWKKNKVKRGLIILWYIFIRNSTGIEKEKCMCTHIDYDIESIIIGQKDTDRATILHGFVVVEVQFVHVFMKGTEQVAPPAEGALDPASTTAGTNTTTQSRYHCFSWNPEQTHQHLGAQQAM